MDWMKKKRTKRQRNKACIIFIWMSMGIRCILVFLLYRDCALHDKSVCPRNSSFTHSTRWANMQDANVHARADRRDRASERARAPKWEAWRSARKMCVEDINWIRWAQSLLLLLLLFLCAISWKCASNNGISISFRLWTFTHLFNGIALFAGNGTDSPKQSR